MTLRVSVLLILGSLALPAEALSPLMVPPAAVIDQIPEHAHRPHPPETSASLVRVVALPEERRTAPPLLDPKAPTAEDVADRFLYFVASLKQPRHLNPRRINRMMQVRMKRDPYVAGKPYLYEGRLRDGSGYTLFYTPNVMGGRSAQTRYLEVIFDDRECPLRFDQVNGRVTLLGEDIKPTAIRGPHGHRNAWLYRGYDSMFWVMLGVDAGALGNDYHADECIRKMEIEVPYWYRKERV